MPLGDPLAIELPTPAGAQTYRVPPITARQFWRLRALNVPWPVALADRGSGDPNGALLTDAVVERMGDEGVLDAHLRLAAQAVLSWHATGDTTAAEQVWAGTEPDLRPVTAEELDQYGYGERDAAGNWSGYDLPPDVAARLNPRPDDGITMAQVWAHADAIAADLLAEYRVDVDGRKMDRRSGPWLRRLVDGLLLADTRLARSLYAETKGGKRDEHTEG